MALWTGALALGLAFAPLAWAVFLSLRVLRFADISVDGTFVTGAAVAAVLLTRGLSPELATLCGFSAGLVGGLVTGLIHTKAGVNDLLSGILVMTAAYSVNLHILGGSNAALMDRPTLLQLSDRLGFRLPDPYDSLATLLALSALLCAAIVWFLKTDLGMAIRATGDNEAMITAQGVNTHRIKILCLALSNGLAGLSGALLAQYQGFVDVSMGIGSLVAGIASVILGETLFGRRSVAWLVLAALAGAIGFRLIVAAALRVGVDPNDLRLLTAGFVLLALLLPGVRTRLLRRGAPA